MHKHALAAYVLHGKIKIKKKSNFCNRRVPTSAPYLQVIVEFDPSDVERFIELADYVEDVFPGIMVDGNPDGDPEAAGVFVIKTEDGQVLFDRAVHDRLPGNHEVVDLITAVEIDTSRKGPGPSCG